MESITLELTPEVVRRISERASKAGTDAEAYMAGIIEREAVMQTFDEILAPVRQGFAESGLSEDEWTEIFEEELGAVREERRLAQAA